MYDDDYVIITKKSKTKRSGNNSSFVFTLLNLHMRHKNIPNYEYYDRQIILTKASMHIKLTRVFSEIPPIPSEFLDLLNISSNGKFTATPLVRT